MQSLAEALGTVPVAGGQESEAEQQKPQSAKVLSRALLNSREYRQSLIDRIALGELPPAVECKLWDYAYGKPVDRVEVKDTTRVLEHLSVEELEERALALAGLARQIRTGAGRSTDDVEPEVLH